MPCGIALHVAFLTGQRTACVTNAGNWLPANWCKVVAVAAEIAKGFDWVVFVDSDAYFAAPHLSIHDFLCSVDHFNVSSGAPLWKANLILPSDCPQYQTNTGIQLWHSTPDSRKTRWMSKKKPSFHKGHQDADLSHMVP